MKSSESTPSEVRAVIGKRVILRKRKDAPISRTQLPARASSPPSVAPPPRPRRPARAVSVSRPPPLPTASLPAPIPREAPVIEWGPAFVDPPPSAPPPSLQRSHGRAIRDAKTSWLAGIVFAIVACLLGVLAAVTQPK